MSTPKEELKPCAHCGSKAHLGFGKDYTFAICPECLLSNDLICESTKLGKEEAVEDWNTRPRESDLIAALKQAREALEVAQKEDCECDCRYEPPSGQCIHCKADEALSRIEQVLGEKK